MFDGIFNLDLVSTLVSSPTRVLVDYTNLQLVAGYNLTSKSMGHFQIPESLVVRRSVVIHGSRCFHNRLHLSVLLNHVCKDCMLILEFVF